MTVYRLLKKYQIFFLAFVLVLTFIISNTKVYASQISEDNSLTTENTDKDMNVVKVGYYENEVFQEGAKPGAVRTGYAYEYYRKLSEYTGWNYEYVYGGFSELYEMLLDGRIDMMAGLAKKEERIGTIGYPTEPMGSETYTLVRHISDDPQGYTPLSVTDKKIGVLNSAVKDVLVEYLDIHSINADIVSFDDYESLFGAFDKKEVDILAAEGDGARGRDDCEVICTFGHSDYYLCVNIKRNDLLEELDTAQSLLAAEEPNYLNSLQSKYYSSSVSGHNFSMEEREWVKENTLLKVGYFDNYLPYSSTGKDGRVTGIVKDIFPDIFRTLSIFDVDISYVGYDNYDDMISDVRKGKLDVCFPVGGGLYYSEENGIYQSQTVASSSTDLVYKGDYEGDDPMHFAVNENNRMQYYYIRTNFPDAEISFYPDIDSCLKAVLREEVGATTLNGLRANEILKNSKYKGLSLRQLNKTDDRSFGVRIGNEGLLKLLNRGIKFLGAEYSQDIAYQYVDDLYTYTFWDMVRDNVWLFLVLLLIIAVLIIAFIIRDLMNTRKATRMKSDFVSNMSHEIRTPITAMIGMNEMILLECEDENILKYADNIEKAGESLLGIINDILDFSKIEAGHMELKEHAYSLPELLRNLYLMIKLRADEKELGFYMEVDEALPVMPIGDMQKLRQVLSNLLINAVKYTEKGEIHLSFKLVSKDDDSFVMTVSVEDSGIGIKREEMHRLYSAFERLDEERTRSIEGSGLGLTITKKLLSIMGSKIDVKSEYGKGSCFSFTLKQGISEGTPIGPFEGSDIDKADATKKRPMATFTAPKARLLIVDDTPMNLQVICGLLKGNELSIDTAGSGEECIELFGKNTYDLVFLDQRMPHMDGVETLNELKTRFPLKEKETPIICLTADVLSGARERMLKVGFADYLTKPVSLNDIEKMLLKYIADEKIHMKEQEEASDRISVVDVKPKLPDIIFDYPQLNPRLGIEYCGDIEDYLFALKTFEVSVDTKAEQIETALADGDFEEYVINVHSLKSTAGAIGATDLSNMACELEQAGKSEDKEVLNRDTPVLLREYHKLKDIIRDILKHSSLTEEDVRAYLR